MRVGSAAVVFQGVEPGSFSFPALPIWSPFVWSTRPVLKPTSPIRLWPLEVKLPRTSGLVGGFATEKFPAMIELARKYWPALPCAKSPPPPSPFAVVVAVEVHPVIVALSKTIALATPGDRRKDIAAIPCGIRRKRRAGNAQDAVAIDAPASYTGAIPFKGASH